MGKKPLSLIPSIFKNKETQKKRHHPWQLLPSCGHSKTLSFRADDDFFKTVNSVFFDPIASTATETLPEPWFTSSSSESASCSTEISDDAVCCFNDDGESLETLVRGVRSERLFFEPGGDTSSILEKAKVVGFPFKESVVLAMESEDPYLDFRRSMEEMVECHGVRDWECLEELLSWYLKVNGKKTHGFIVGAFVDLLVSLAATSIDNQNSCSDSTLYCSAVSSFASSSLHLSEGQISEIVDEHEDPGMS